jgi:hypothetical protein
MEETKVEYEKPKIEDYGDMWELTATSTVGIHADVPKGTPVPPLISIFS